MRPIDADKLKETIKELEVESPDVKATRFISRTIQEIFPQIIDDEPTIEAEPVKHAQWIRKHNSFPQRYFCTNCGEGAVRRFAFCPYCGYKMGGLE